MMSPPLPGAAILHQLKNRKEHFIWQMFTAKSFHSENIIFYIIKEFVQPKMSPTSREREREGVREREAGGQAGQQAGIFKVRSGLEEIDIETEIKRNGET
jgi:hypothetical protein